MKKISLVLSALVLFAGVSFANPVVKHTTQQAGNKTEKKTTKPEKKGGKKGSKAAKSTPAAK